MEHTLTTTHSLSSNAKSENAPIFGLYYLEEQELDLNEVVGCFGVSSIAGPEVMMPTCTCPSDDYDDGGEPI